MNIWNSFRMNCLRSIRLLNGRAERSGNCTSINTRGRLYWRYRQPIPPCCSRQIPPKRSSPSPLLRSSRRPNVGSMLPSCGSIRCTSGPNGSYSPNMTGCCPFTASISMTRSNMSSSSPDRMVRCSSSPPAVPVCGPGWVRFRINSTSRLCVAGWSSG